MKKIFHFLPAVHLRPQRQQKGKQAGWCCSPQVTVTTTPPSGCGAGEETLEGWPLQSTYCWKYLELLKLAWLTGAGSYQLSVTTDDLTQGVDAGGSGQTSSSSPTSTDHSVHLGLVTALPLHSRTDSGNFSFPLPPSEVSSEAPSKIVLLTLSEKAVLLVV